MTEELAAAPTWRRRFGAALAGLGVYVLMLLTAFVLPSAIGDKAAFLGLIAAVLVAGGVARAGSPREWLTVGLLTVLVVIIAVATFVLAFLWYSYLSTPGEY
jgi:4-amino-4-deoxy-L-arabinose transferase-like glycosyltransferase